MARLDLNFSEVYIKVSEYLGLGSAPAGDNLTKVKAIVYRAYNRFLNPLNTVTGKRHVWSFLKRRHVIQTQGDVWKYPLPPNFGRMLGKPQYDSGTGRHQLTKVGGDYILQRRAYHSSKSYPCFYSLEPLKQDDDVGTRWEIWVWPEANGAYPITFTYEVLPEKPVDTTDFFFGPPFCSEVILELALSIAEIQEEDAAGVHSQIATGMLQDLILQDDIDCPDTVGSFYPRTSFYPRAHETLTSDEIYYGD